MRKIIYSILLVLSLSSCSVTSHESYRGCEYKISSNIFYKYSYIELTSSYSPLDVYVIILDVIHNRQVSSNGIVIYLPISKQKFLINEDNLEIIKENIPPITDENTVMEAVNKMIDLSELMEVYKY